MPTVYFSKIPAPHETHDIFWSQGGPVGSDYDYLDPFGNSASNQTTNLIKNYAIGFPRNLKQGDIFTFTQNVNKDPWFTALGCSHLVFFTTAPVQPTSAGRIHKFVYLSGGTPNELPTYLEELSKLDQFTKAQYIPNGRQRLDI